MSPLDMLAARIRGEYREMPGLRLTFAQACRLWQVDEATCELLLSTLLTEHFLTRTHDGAFVARSASGGRAVAVKATLRPDPTMHPPVRRSA